MTKLINIISSIGILFLIGFWVFNFVESEKTRKELKDLKASLDSQKDKYFQALRKAYANYAQHWRGII